MKYLNRLFVFHIFAIALIATIVYGAPIYNDDDEFESEPNTRSGLLISQWNDSWAVNPDELGSYFQGDIITPTTDLRSVVKNESLRWPYGIVPYVIAGPYNDEGLELLEWALNQYHENTCIRFKPKEPQDADYLYISNGFTGCWSALGRQGGKQEINLQHPGCLTKKRRGTSIHELMHALGVKHEHTRVDRDNHIIVLHENVSPSRAINFLMSTDEEATNYNVPYDFGSVMHYSKFAFSTDYGNKPTIQPIIPDELISPDGTEIKMGQRDGFGPNDIKKLNQMYCPELGEHFEHGAVVSLTEEREDEASSPLATWWIHIIKAVQESFD